MAIVKMKRLRLVGLNDQKDKLLDHLLRLGCVAVNEPNAQLSDPEWTSLLRRDESLSANVKADLSNLRTALEGLNKYAPAKGGLFIKRKNITEEELFSPEAQKTNLAAVESINENLRDIAQIFGQQNRIATQKAALQPWTSLDIPLECEGTLHTSYIMGACPAAVELQAMEQDLIQACEEACLFPISSDEEQNYFLLISHQNVADAALAALRPHSFSVTRFKGMTGTAISNIDQLTQEFNKLEQEKEAAINNIAAYKDLRGELQIYQDRLNQELSKELTQERFLTNGTVFFFEGWVPAPEEEKLSQDLAAFTCAYEMTDPEPGDAVPTLLKNNSVVEPMNMVTEMYSLPTYSNIDPNPLIFPFYVFFFGLMFADIAYGLIMVAACIALKIFVKPKGGLRRLTGLGILVGISTTICGYFTGSCFGDAIPVINEVFLNNPGVEMWSLINPLNDPMGVLIFAIVVGVFHLIVGQCIHIYVCFRDKHGLDGLLDVVPWWIFFASIGGIVLTGKFWPIFIGLGVLVLTQGHSKKGIFKKLFGGIVSLYDVTSWLSDILSYSRLMALMLATAVIASVVNILGSLNGSLIMFAIIFLVGHIFNLGINLVGTYVHAARLQYLEFFSKFYENGGIPFRPLRYNTKYVDVVGQEIK